MKTLEQRVHEHFGSSLRVYEKKHLFPGLLVNYEEETDDDDRDPDWLSKMFEYDFIRFLKLTSHDQISQFSQNYPKGCFTD